MAITFVNSSTAQGGTGTGVSSLVVTKPSGTADGDLIMVKVVPYGAGTTVTLSGFNTLETLFTGPLNTVDNYVSFWKIASGEPATWTLNFNAAIWVVAVAYVLRGTSASPIAHHAKKDDASAYTTTLPAAPSTIDGSTDATVYDYGGFDSTQSGAVTVTMPGGLSNTVQITNSSSGNVLAVGWGTNVSAPGSATSDTALDYTDTFVDVSPAATFAGDDDGLVYLRSTWW